MASSCLTQVEILRISDQLKPGCRLELQFNTLADKSLAKVLREMMDKGFFCEEISTWALLSDISRLGWRQCKLRCLTFTVADGFDLDEFKAKIKGELIYLEVWG